MASSPLSGKVPVNVRLVPAQQELDVEVDQGRVECDSCPRMSGCYGTCSKRESLKHTTLGQLNADKDAEC